MNDIKIMKPTMKDQKEINKLAKQVHKLHVNWNPDLFLDVEQVISNQRLDELLKNDSIYVAKIDKKIIGYIILKIKEQDNGIMRKRKLMTIDTLCVDESFRGQGIGTNMLNFAKKLGKEKECTDLYLTVNPKNKNAINVYEKFGMKVKDIAYTCKI